METANLVLRIKDIKRKNKLTNEKLAEISGLTLSNVGKLLSYRIPSPSFDSILKIANALNISIDYLVYGDSGPVNKIRTGEEFQLLENFRRLDDNEKNEVLKYTALQLLSHNNK